MGFVFARITRLRSDRPRMLTARPPFQLALLLSLLTPWSASAAEQAEEFVKGLQERGLHDLAQEYLEGLKTSPLANDATKRQVPYLRGVALIEQSRQSTDPTVRNRLLDEARKELEQFAEANPQNVEGAEAQLQLATVQMTRGQELIAQAAQLPKEPAYDSQRKDLGRDARLAICRSSRHLSAGGNNVQQRVGKTAASDQNPMSSRKKAAVGKNCGRALHSYGSLPRKRNLKRRNRIRLRPTNSASSTKRRLQNCRRFTTSFRDLLVGLYARLYEGRCYQAIGNYQLAMGCYEEILGKINALPAFRKLVAATIRRKAEVLIAQGKFDEAIEACNACLSDAHSDEQRQAEWVAVRFRLADALSKKAQASAADTTENRKFTTEAREAYRLVAKSPGEFQVAARAASTASASGARASRATRPKAPQLRTQ